MQGMAGSQRNTASVVVFNSNPLARLGLRTILERDGGITLRGEAADRAEMHRALAEHQPDVLVVEASELPLDIAAPGVHRYPAVVVTLSQDTDAEHLVDLVRSDVRAIVDLN